MERGQVNTPRQREIWHFKTNGKNLGHVNEDEN
jgi:hypothetical protein